MPGKVSDFAYNVPPGFIVNFSGKSVEPSSLPSEVRTRKLEISTADFSRFKTATRKF